MSEEFRHAWLENLLDVQNMRDLLEQCDKECHTCSKDEKNDCLIEMRECLYSMVTMLENFIRASMSTNRIDKNGFSGMIS